jgi:hypothetical protein
MAMQAGVAFFQGCRTRPLKNQENREDQGKGKVGAIVTFGEAFVQLPIAGLNIMPSRILEMIKAKVSQLPKEVPKPQKPIKEPKIKKDKKTNIKL